MKRIGGFTREAEKNLKDLRVDEKEPGGFAAISRWLSAAIPPENVARNIPRIPAGMPASGATIPAGIGFNYHPSTGG